MKSTFLAILMCCLALLPTRIGAEQSRPEQAQEVRPNLAGTWTSIRAAYEAQANTGVGLRIGPSQGWLIITQDADSLTVVERYTVFPDNKVVYRPDGQVVRNRFRVPLDTVPSEVTSGWQKGSLVSKILVFVPGETEPRRYRQTLSLNADGLLAVRYEDDSSNTRTVFYQKK